MPYPGATLEPPDERPRRPRRRRERDPDERREELEEMPLREARRRLGFRDWRSYCIIHRLDLDGEPPRKDTRNV